MAANVSIAPRAAEPLPVAASPWLKKNSGARGPVPKPPSVPQQAYLPPPSTPPPSMPPPQHWNGMYTVNGSVAPPRVQAQSQLAYSVPPRASPRRELPGPPPNKPTRGPSLPAGWTAVKDANGDTYYWHEPSGRTSWDIPTGLDYRTL